MKRIAIYLLFYILLFSITFGCETTVPSYKMRKQQLDLSDYNDNYVSTYIYNNLSQIESRFIPNFEYSHIKQLQDLSCYEMLIDCIIQKRFETNYLVLSDETQILGYDSDDIQRFICNYVTTQIEFVMYSPNNYVMSYCSENNEFICIHSELIVNLASKGNDATDYQELHLGDNLVQIDFFFSFDTDEPALIGWFENYGGSYQLMFDAEGTQL